MTTLDDKILGEKLQYYYSSSEDEESDHEEDEGQSKTIREQEVLQTEIDYSPDGTAVNTGVYLAFSSCTFDLICSYCLYCGIHSLFLIMVF